MDAQAILHFRKMLMNLDQCLAKAVSLSETKKFDINVLSSYRLAPDMYPFTGQIQAACDAAKFCAAYLSGQTPPKHDDTEKTWSELRERIQKVINYLESFNANSFAKAEEVKVTPGWAKGKWLPANEYLHQIAIPNFYFHLMAAYAILRHAGVDIGKMDYMGAMELRG